MNLMTEKNIAVIGAGYWGKNLVRNFHQLGVLKTICDGAQPIREEMSKTYSGTDFKSVPLITFM
jgi:UDP-2-acetamido-3-amino-2,3-dideoxy-glucuronate N-acetyltransferase